MQLLAQKWSERIEDFELIQRAICLTSTRELPCPPQLRSTLADLLVPPHRRIFQQSSTSPRNFIPISSAVSLNDRIASYPKSTTNSGQVKPSDHSFGKTSPRIGTPHGINELQTAYATQSPSNISIEKSNKFNFL